MRTAISEPVFVSHRREQTWYLHRLYFESTEHVVLVRVFGVRTETDILGVVSSFGLSLQLQT
jgi:hypothetical protein